MNTAAYGVRNGGGSRVVRLHPPTAKSIRVLEVPVSQPTCVAFGGPDRDLLFVSSGGAMAYRPRSLRNRPHARRLCSFYRVKF